MKRLNILMVSAWYPATATRFFADAFEQLGHRVFRVGPTYFDHYGLAWPESDLPAVDYRLQRKLPVWNLNTYIDMATVVGFVPNILFLSEETYQTHIIPTDKVRVVLWSADGWKNSFDRKTIIKPTLAYTQHPFGVNPSPQENIPEGWRFLPGGYDQQIHRYVNTGERKVDFTLYCTMYGKRQQICDELQKLNFAVSCGQRTTEKYVSGYNNSKYTYHNCNGQAELKWRGLESMAMGCVNIADDNRLFPVLDFQPYRDYIPIEDFNPEFDEGRWPNAAAIGRAMVIGRKYPEISELARMNVEANHSYSHRIQRILVDLGFDNETGVEDWDAKFRTVYPSNV